MLPPNQYTLLDGKTKVIHSTVMRAREQYKYFMKVYRKKQSNYVDGALYTKLFKDNVDFIWLCPSETVVINVTLEDGCSTVIKFFYDNNAKYNEHLRNCRALGKFLCECKPNTFRRNRMDEGKMFIVGNGKLGNGRWGTFKLTEKKGISKLLQNIVSSASKYYQLNGFDEQIHDAWCERLSENHRCMKGSHVSSIVSSVNLINSAHLDINNKSKSIVTWTTDSMEEVDNWYFIMPNLTTDGSRALVLEIKDGVTINWDATKIMHCSTTKANECDYNVYGTYFGY